jgi:hypothetical protein
MSRALTACLLGLASILIVSPAISGADAPAVKRGEMKAVMVEKGPAVDGTLNDPLWKKCPPIELGEATSSKPAFLRTTARVLFGPTHLYLAVECEEPDTEGMTAKVTERDGSVWGDDSIELFVTGDPRERYYQFIFNSAGVMMDGSFKRGAHTDRSWNSSAVVKATVQRNKRWTVTAAIPLKELSAYVGDDLDWTLNINRNRKGAPGRQRGMFAWSIMESTDWKAVNDYGVIEGVRIPKRPDGVTRVAPPAPKRPKYIEPEEAGGVLIYKRLPEWTLRDEGKGTRGGFPLPIKGSRGLKLAFLARGTGGASGVFLNFYDARARDNTTPVAYRWIDETWRPVVYRVSLFRYNAIPNSRIAASNDFRRLTFHGNATGKAVLTFRQFVVYRGEDRAAPAAPQGVSAKATDGGVRLDWKPADDNVGVAGYVLSRAAGDGPFVKLGECAAPGFVDRPSVAGACRYRVLAFDFQENLSAWSKVATVEAGKAFPATKPTELQSDRLGYGERIRKIRAAGEGKVIKGRVFCFGDSLTHALNYGLAVASALGNHEVIARGYPAQRTSFGRGRIDRDLADVNPEFCLILLGTNNRKSEKAIAAAMEDQKAMIESCARRGVVPVIGTIPPRGFRDPQSQPEARYNAALIRTCREAGVPIAYIFKGHQDSGIDRRKLLAGDGVHTITGGWQVMGKAWRAAMQQVRFTLRDRP